MLTSASHLLASLCVWKCLSELFPPSSSQGLKWGWPVRSSPNCPLWPFFKSTVEFTFSQSSKSLWWSSQPFKNDQCYIQWYIVFLSQSQGGVVWPMFSLIPCILIYFISFYNTVGSKSLKSWNFFRFQTRRKVVWPKACLYFVFSQWCLLVFHQLFPFHSNFLALVTFCHCRTPSLQKEFSNLLCRS